MSEMPPDATVSTQIMRETNPAMLKSIDLPHGEDA
jgi:hypothetical protein